MERFRFASANYRVHEAPAVDQGRVLGPRGSRAGGCGLPEQVLCDGRSSELQRCRHRAQWAWAARGVQLVWTWAPQRGWGAAPGASGAWAARAGGGGGRPGVVDRGRHQAAGTLHSSPGLSIHVPSTSSRPTACFPEARPRCRGDWWLCPQSISTLAHPLLSPELHSTSPAVDGVRRRCQRPFCAQDSAHLVPLAWSVRRCAELVSSVL